MGEYRVKGEGASLNLSSVSSHPLRSDSKQCLPPGKTFAHFVSQGADQRKESGKINSRSSLNSRLKYRLPPPPSPQPPTPSPTSNFTETTCPWRKKSLVRMAKRMGNRLQRRRAHQAIKIYGGCNYVALKTGDRKSRQWRVYSGDNWLPPASPRPPPMPPRSLWCKALGVGGGRGAHALTRAHVNFAHPGIDDGLFARGVGRAGVQGVLGAGRRRGAAADHLAALAGLREEGPGGWRRRSPRGQPGRWRGRRGWWRRRRGPGVPAGRVALHGARRAPPEARLRLEAALSPLAAGVVPWRVVAG